LVEGRREKRVEEGEGKRGVRGVVEMRKATVCINAVI
jgi:hypothetical protein